MPHWWFSEYGPGPAFPTSPGNVSDMRITWPEPNHIDKPSGSLMPISVWQPWLWTIESLEEPPQAGHLSGTISVIKTYINKPYFRNLLHTVSIQNCLQWHFAFICILPSINFCTFEKWQNVFWGHLWLKILWSSSICFPKSYSYKWEILTGNSTMNNFLILWKNILNLWTF